MTTLNWGEWILLASQKGKRWLVKIEDAPVATDDPRSDPAVFQELCARDERDGVGESDRSRCRRRAAGANAAADAAAVMGVVARRRRIGRRTAVHGVAVRAAHAMLARGAAVRRTRAHERRLADRENEPDGETGAEQAARPMAAH